MFVHALFDEWLWLGDPKPNLPFLCVPSFNPSLRHTVIFIAKQRCREDELEQMMALKDQAVQHQLTSPCNG